MDLRQLNTRELKRLADKNGVWIDAINWSKEQMIDVLKVSQAVAARPFRGEKVPPWIPLTEDDFDFSEWEPVNPFLLDAKTDEMFQEERGGEILREWRQRSWNGDKKSQLIYEALHLAIGEEDPEALDADQAQLVYQVLGNLRQETDYQIHKCEMSYLSNVANRNLYDQVIKSVEAAQRKKYNDSWRRGIPPPKRRKHQ